LPKVIWERPVYATKFPLVTMGNITFAPKITHSRGTIPKTQLSALSLDPSDLPSKPHPHLISRSATMHRTDRQTESNARPNNGYRSLTERWVATGRYIQLLVQEMAVKVEVGFLLSLLATVKYEVPDDSKEFARSLQKFVGDVNSAQLSVVSEAREFRLQMQEHLYDYIHLSPIKASFVLSSSSSSSSMSFRATQVQKNFRAAVVSLSFRCGYGR